MLSKIDRWSSSYNNIGQGNCSLQNECKPNINEEFIMNDTTMNVNSFLNIMKGNKTFSVILLLTGFILGSVTTYKFASFGIKYKLCDPGGGAGFECRTQCLRSETPRATGLTCQQCLAAGGVKCW